MGKKKETKKEMIDGCRYKVIRFMEDARAFEMDFSSVRTVKAGTIGIVFIDNYGAVTGGRVFAGISLQLKYINGKGWYNHSVYTDEFGKLEIVNNITRDVWLDQRD